MKPGEYYFVITLSIRIDNKDLMDVTVCNTLTTTAKRTRKQVVDKLMIDVIDQVRAENNILPTMEDMDILILFLSIEPN